MFICYTRTLVERYATVLYLFIVTYVSNVRKYLIRLMYSVRIYILYLGHVVKRIPEFVTQPRFVAAYDLKLVYNPR